MKRLTLNIECLTLNIECLTLLYYADMSRIAYDVWIHHIAPYAADDDAKTLRETCSALRTGIDATHVYSDRRYHVPTSRRRLRNVIILNVDELKLVDRDTVETMILYDASQNDLREWFAGSTTWSALHTLDIRYRYSTYSGFGNAILTRVSLPKLDTLCVSSAGFNVGFAEARFRGESAAPPIRVHFRHMRTTIDTTGFDNLGTVHIGKYDRRRVVFQRELDTVFIDSGGWSELFCEDVLANVRHLAIVDWNLNNGFPVNTHAVRELTVFDSQLIFYFGHIHVMHIDLKGFTNLEHVNVACPARVVNVPDGCVVNRMTSDETRASRQRLTVACLDS